MRLWVLNTSRFLWFTLGSGFHHPPTTSWCRVLLTGTNQPNCWLIFSSWACICLFIKCILLIVSHKGSATSGKIYKSCTVWVKVVKLIPSLWLGSRRKWYRNKGDYKTMSHKHKTAGEVEGRFVSDSHSRTSVCIPSDFFSLHGDIWRLAWETKESNLKEISSGETVFTTKQGRFKVAHRGSVSFSLQLTSLRLKNLKLQMDTDS